MSAVAMPARTWGRPVVEPAPAPRVLVSSWDGAPVPVVRGVNRLTAALAAAGWMVRRTYALAEVPATGRKPAHELATIAVRAQRDDARVAAVWHREGDGAWRFDSALLASGASSPCRLGYRQLTARVSAP